MFSLLSIISFFPQVQFSHGLPGIILSSSPQNFFTTDLSASYISSSSFIKLACSVRVPHGLFCSVVYFYVYAFLSFSEVPPALNAGLCTVMYLELVCMKCVNPVILRVLMIAAESPTSFRLRDESSSRTANKFLVKSLSSNMS